MTTQTTKVDRIERLTTRLTKLARKYRLPFNPELGEALLMFSAVCLEHHVDTGMFLERARTWWDVVTTTHPTDPTKRLGPDLPTMERQAREMAEVIRATAPVGAGFALVVYNFGPKGEMTYLSTGDRNSTIGMLDGLVQTLRQQREQTPSGELRS